ncbi:MAG TPA: peptide chain release factor N(5)-glutamine methyltransferase [Gemmatimonadales bacterium]
MPELALLLGAAIDEAAGRLRSAGIREARREAMWIWAELSGRGPEDAVLQRHHPVEASVAGAFQNAVVRRSRGEPLAHVTGWSGFRRISLRSDRRALIPRPETEGLVELLLDRVRTGRVADVGTGSGCLALSLALEGSFTLVTGVDCSAAALELARENRDLVGADINLVRGDLCGPLGRGMLDALVSNPPYLTAAEYAALDPSVRDWEPATALVSGEDGMAATLGLLVEAGEALRPGGWLGVEVDCTRAGLAARHASTLNWTDVSVHMDLFGRERYLLARRSETR